MIYKKSPTRECEAGVGRYSRERFFFVTVRLDGRNRSGSRATGEENKTLILYLRCSKSKLFLLIERIL